MMNENENEEYSRQNVFKNQILYDVITLCLTLVVIIFSSMYATSDVIIMKTRYGCHST